MIYDSHRTSTYSFVAEPNEQLPHLLAGVSAWLMGKDIRQEDVIALTLERQDGLLAIELTLAGDRETSTGLRRWPEY